MTKIPEPILAVLKEHDVEYDIVKRKKHDMLYVEGRAACVLSKGSGRTKHCTAMNSAQRVKRLIRSIK